MARTDHPHIRDWLKALGSLTAFAGTATEFGAKTSAYAPLLATDFPQAAFSPVSLAMVARQCKFFPSYAEICTHLGPWWREHRPPPIVNALHSPNGRTHAEWQEMAEQSWRDVTGAEVRAKIADTQLIPNAAQRKSLGSILAHAIATHAPHHFGLLPPEWTTLGQPA